MKTVALIEIIKKDKSGISGTPASVPHYSSGLVVFMKPKHTSKKNRNEFL